MMHSTIGWCAVFLLLLKLGTSPPPAAADQSFRGSRLYRTMDDGCASFTAKSSCLTGTGECTWYPQNGCVSARAMTRTTDRVILHGDEGDKNKGDDEASLRVSRKLKTPTTPRPTSPTNKSTTRSPTNKPTLTCPQQYCTNDIITTTSSTGCAGLVATTLATFVFQGEVLIELTGPSNPINAADLVITAPHGGSKEPEFIPNRQTSGSFCPTEGCKTDKDSYTLEISQLLQS